MKVEIIGAGLMGGSVALALQAAGHEIQIRDSSVAIQLQAQTFLRIQSKGFSAPDMIVVAVPPKSVSQVIMESNRQFPDATLIDIASVMTNPLLEVKEKNIDIPNWIPTHPMAGKETGGFENSSYDLFKDRLWVISPQPSTEAWRIEQVEKLIQDCGAIPFFMDPVIHDETVAITSHLPQVLAIALAEQLVPMSDESLAVSGQGLKDMTRIANSSGELWKEILLANKSNISSALDSIIHCLSDLKITLEQNKAEGILAHFEKGNRGKGRIPGKHGGAPEEFAALAIEIDDKPGQLAAIFATAGVAKVNIEDVRIDHALGKEVATVYLYVEKNAQDNLASALLADNWNLRTPFTSE